MNSPESNSVDSTASWRSKHRAIISLLLWLGVAGVLGYGHLSDPGFAVQGDVPLHYQLTRAFARNLTEGQWLPRWAGLLDGGRGDAVFTFYGPLYYWPGSGLVAFFRVSVLAALGSVTFLSLILAQANTYLLARVFWGRSASLLASVLYVVLPAYPLLALNRAFLPNAFAVSLLPLALLGSHLLLRGEQRRRGLVFYTLGLSAIILTHAITTYLCVAALALMGLCYLPQAGWRPLRRLVGSTLLALALTAFFWVPQLVEMRWVPIGEELPHNYRHYFLFAAAADESHYRQAWAGINYVASLITLMQTALALTIGVVCWQALRRSAAAELLRFSLAVSLVGLFISLPLSDALWCFVPGMEFIQFPWRFQAFVALGIAMLAAAAYEQWPQLGRRSKTVLAALLTWLVLGNLVLTFMVVRPRGGRPERQASLRLLLNNQVASLSREQFRALSEDKDFRSLAISANQIYFRPRGAERELHPPVAQIGSLSILSGRGRVVAQSLMNSHRAFQFENEEPIRVRIDTYNYPNWVVRLDGRIVKAEAEPGSGLILVEVPAGSHTLTLDFEIVSPVERWARVISGLTCLLVIGLELWKGFSQARLNCQVLRAANGELTS